MKKTVQSPKGLGHPYARLRWRLLISILAAHYILTHTSKYGFLQIISVNGYWPSLIGSFIIAFSLVEVTLYISVKLDKHSPYSSNWKKRMVQQVAFGLIGVAALAFFLAWGYFLINQKATRISRYIDHDFPIIIAFVIGLNAYCFIRYLYNLNQLLSKRLANQEKQKKVLLKVTEPISTAALANEIAFIIKLDRRYKVAYKDGREFPWYTSIRKSINDLPSKEYFAINHRCIVAIDIIGSISSKSSKRYALNLIPPFHLKLSEKDCTVSQANKITFDKWFVLNQ